MFQLWNNVFKMFLHSTTKIMIFSANNYTNKNNSVDYDNS